MLCNHFTEELTGLQDILIKEIKQEEKITKIYLEIKRKSVVCPCCGAKTCTVHDYRTQEIKDAPAFGKNVILILRKRRYRCQSCGKRFAESNEFLPKYHRMTTRLV